MECRSETQMEILTAQKSVDLTELHLDIQKAQHWADKSETNWECCLALQKAER